LSVIVSVATLIGLTLASLLLVALASDAWLRRRARRLPRGRSAPVIWAHKGGYHLDGIEPNTLEALDAAVARGYTGVELDVRHVPGHGLLLSYDPVAPGAEGRLLRLEQFLSRYGTALSYWIDFKNLGPLNGSEAAGALAEVLSDPELAKRCIVESRWPQGLAALRRKLPQARLLPIVHSHPALLPIGRWMIRLFDFRAVSMDHRWINAAAIESFGHLPIFSYTVNDPEEVRRLSRLGVDVILTDELAPDGVQLARHAMVAPSRIGGEGRIRTSETR
jgi:glycerophosphoryl diester phosphodiesterase